MNWLHLLFSTFYFLSSTVAGEESDLFICVYNLNNFDKVNSKNDIEFIRHKGFLQQGIIYREGNSESIYEEYLDIGYILEDEFLYGVREVRWLSLKDSRYDHDYTLASIKSNAEELAFYEFEKNEVFDVLSNCLSEAELLEITTILK